MRVLVPVIPVKDELILSPHFSRAVAFALFEIEGDSYRFELHRNPVPPQQERGRGRSVVVFISKLKPEVIIAKSIGPGAFEKLRALGIKVVKSEDRSAEEAVKRFIRGELEDMREPEYEHES